ISIGIVLGIFFWKVEQKPQSNSTFDKEWSLFIIVLLLTSPYANIQDASILIASAISFLRWRQAITRRASRYVLIICILIGYILGNGLLDQFILFHTW